MVDPISPNPSPYCEHKERDRASARGWSSTDRSQPAGGARAHQHCVEIYEVFDTPVYFGGRFVGTKKSEGIRDAGASWRVEVDRATGATASASTHRRTFSKRWARARAAARQKMRVVTRLFRLGGGQLEHETGQDAGSPSPRASRSSSTACEEKLPAAMGGRGREEQRS